MKRHRYTMNEIKWLGEDYADGMKMRDIMTTYGLTEKQVRSTVSRFKFHRKKHTAKKPTARKQQEPKYMWALVTADEKELPITPYYDTVRELAKNAGMKFGTIYASRSRKATLRYRTREGVIKVRAIRIDAE